MGNYSKVLLTIFCFSIVQCGQEYDSMSSTKLNPAELEEDFAPGFFESHTDLTEEDHEGGETNEELGDFETVLERSDFQPLFRFSQTRWNECSEAMTGNYLTYRCTSRRGISVILKSFLNNHLYQCVDEGLAAQGGGQSDEIHIVHAGIAGDPRHSPRSLHAEQRAIDLKVLKIKLTNGQQRQFTYSKLGNRPFYTALRKCWGRTVSRYNECPLYRGEPLLTGSIGWENRNHGKHMHMSVPYCYNNRHGSHFWYR